VSDRGGWKPYAVGCWYHPEHGRIERWGESWHWYPRVQLEPVSHGPYPTLTAAIAAVRKMTERCWRLTCPECKQTIAVNETVATPCGCSGSTWRINRNVKVEAMPGAD
jgi:hypothetical protein